MDPRLIEYIKNCLKRGLAPGQIRHELIKAGWEPKQVGEAIDWVMDPVAPVAEKKSVTKTAGFSFLMNLTLAFVTAGLIIMFVPFPGDSFEKISGNKFSFTKNGTKITKIADYNPDKDGLIYGLSPRRTKVILKDKSPAGYIIPGCEICGKYLITHAGFLDDDELIFTGYKEYQKHYLVQGENEITPSVAELIFSEEKKHFAYTTYSSDILIGLLEYKIFLDNKEIAKISFNNSDVDNHDYITIKDLIISPDGNKVAFVVSYRKNAKAVAYEVIKEVVYVNDKPSKDYAKISTEITGYYDSTLRFSPDSQRIAYVAKKLGFPDDNLGLVVVIDDREFETESVALGLSRYSKGSISITGLGEYIDGNLIRFSPDSQRFLFETSSIDSVTRLQNIPSSQSLVIDGEEKKYDKVYDALFSPDGKHIAYYTHEKERVSTMGSIILDDKVFKEFGNGFKYAGGLGFTKNNEIYYTAKDDKGVFMKTGEEESKRYEGIYGLQFNKDKSKYAFMAFAKYDNDSKSIRNKLIMDGKEVDEHVIGFQFSPNGGHYAYFKSDNPEFVQSRDPKNKKYLVLDGKQYVFEGNSVNELARSENNYLEDINIPVFSEDSKEVRYNVIKDNAIYLVTVPTE